MSTERSYEKFFTPMAMAAYMASLLDAKDGDVVLEPSAGKGAIVRAIKRQLYTSWDKGLEISNFL